MQAGQLNDLFNSNIQKNKELDELIATINTEHSQAQQTLERIKGLLEEVETKSKQYDSSNKQMNNLMVQLGQLIDGLNKVTNNGNETAHE